MQNISQVYLKRKTCCHLTSFNWGWCSCASFLKDLTSRPCCGKRCGEIWNHLHTITTMDPEEILDMTFSKCTKYWNSSQCGPRVIDGELLHITSGKLQCGAQLFTIPDIEIVWMGTLKIQDPYLSKQKMRSTTITWRKSCAFSPEENQNCLIS